MEEITSCGQAQLEFQGTQALFWQMARARTPDAVGACSGHASGSKDIAGQETVATPAIKPSLRQMPSLRSEVLQCSHCPWHCHAAIPWEHPRAKGVAGPEACSTVCVGKHSSQTYGTQSGDPEDSWNLTPDTLGKGLPLGSMGRVRRRSAVYPHHVVLVSLL